MSKRRKESQLPKYFPRIVCPRRELKARLASGTIRAWRTDTQGIAWFERVTPGEPAEIEADQEDPEQAKRNYEVLVMVAARTTDNIPPEIGAQILADAGMSFRDFAADVALVWESDN